MIFEIKFVFVDLSLSLFLQTVVFCLCSSLQMDSDLGFIASSESVVSKMKQSKPLRQPNPSKKMKLSSSNESPENKLNALESRNDYNDENQNDHNDFSKIFAPNYLGLGESKIREKPLFPDRYVRVFTPEDYYIAGITFGVKGPDEILAQSVCEITENTIYNKNVPRHDAINDVRMGTVDRRIVCGTCGHGVVLSWKDAVF